MMIVAAALPQFVLCARGRFVGHGRAAHGEVRLTCDRASAGTADCSSGARNYTVQRRLRVADADQIPYLRIAADTPFDLAIIAWEQKLKHRISLIPNIEYVTYRDNGDAKAPDDDLYGRVTLYFEF